MHRGTYSKIPVIMGDYPMDISKNKIRRSWYSNDNGGLYYVKADGITVIDVWRSIINKHEQEGNHERLWTESPINLRIQQKLGDTYKNITDISEIHGSHENAYGKKNGDTIKESWDLIINQPLSLGLAGTGILSNNNYTPIVLTSSGVAINDGKNNPKIVDKLPISYGGTNVTSFNQYNSDIIQERYINVLVTNGEGIYKSKCCIQDAIYETTFTPEEPDALPTTRYVRKLYDMLVSRITDLENTVSDLDTKYASKAKFNNAVDAINKFAQGLPEDITKMIFPTNDFNGMSGVRILQLSLSGEKHGDRKGLKLKINKDTGYGRSPAGDGSIIYRDRYNHTDPRIDLYGSNTSTSISDGAENDTSKNYGPSPAKFNADVKK